MFEKGKEVSSRLKSITWFLTIALMVLLVSGPIHATDPIDVDPDPDYAPTATMIFVKDIDHVDLKNLSPGHYVIVVIAEDGPNETHEIFVQ